MAQTGPIASRYGTRASPRSQLLQWRGAPNQSESGSNRASAYQIADDLSQARGKRVAPNSVYRILDLFVAHSLAVKIESANAFIANAHPGEVHDCVFLVCDACGNASHVDSEDIGQSLRAIAQAQEFLAERPVLEIRGVCSECK